MCPIGFSSGVAGPERVSFSQPLFGHDRNEDSIHDCKIEDQLPILHAKRDEVYPIGFSDAWTTQVRAWTNYALVCHDWLRAFEEKQLDLRRVHMRRQTDRHRDGQAYGRTDASLCWNKDSL
jgi:hypothetical protein